MCFCWEGRAATGGEGEGPASSLTRSRRNLGGETEEAQGRAEEHWRHTFLRPFFQEGASVGTAKEMGNKLAKPGSARLERHPIGKGLARGGKTVGFPPALKKTRRGVGTLAGELQLRKLRSESPEAERLPSKKVYLSCGKKTPDKTTPSPGELGVRRGARCSTREGRQVKASVLQSVPG